MRTRTAALLVTALATLAGALLVGAAAASASPGLDQYVEQIPDGDGDDQATRDEHKDGGGNGGGDDGGSTSGPTVDSSQLDALRSQGEDGARAAAALEATSNVRDDGGPGPADAGPAGHANPPLDSSEADGQAPVEAILSSMFGGGGGGILLPIIMLAVLVGGLVMAARSHRNSLGD
jgi:hypothetical protein